MIRKILCAVDLGENSDRVVEVAYHYAESFGAELILLCVVDSPLLTLTAGYGALKLPEDEVEALGRAAASFRQQAEDQLDRLASTIAPGAAIRVIEGHPAANVVIEIVEYEKPDLLVVGSHGRRKIKRLLLGSACHRLVQASPVPVLVVKTPPKEWLVEQERERREKRKLLLDGENSGPQG